MINILERQFDPPADEADRLASGDVFGKKQKALWLKNRQ